jgi:hypothetical protein
MPATTQTAIALEAHCARDEEDASGLCHRRGQRRGQDANPTRCCICARSALAGRYILVRELLNNASLVGHTRQKA